MRLWHVKLLPYLPDLQFKGQLREIVVIMRSWRDNGKTNHLLINRVMEYPKAYLCWYFKLFQKEYEKRYNKTIKSSIIEEFEDFHEPTTLEFSLYDGWHNKEYLRVCMANLYEKHHFGKGRSRITTDEWFKLVEGYRNITGENYII